MNQKNQQRLQLINEVIRLYRLLTPGPFFETYESLCRAAGFTSQEEINDLYNRSYP